MMSAPTLYLANFASLRRPDPAVVGTGRRWTAMARPRLWERGHGRVLGVSPPPDALRAVQAGTITPTRYFAVCRERFAAWASAGLLVPERLCGESADGWVDDVADGDFIGCSCARDAALRGECHLFHAAPFLVRAGWRVVLHGQEVTP